MSGYNCGRDGMAAKARSMNTVPRCVMRRSAIECCMLCCEEWVTWWLPNVVASFHVRAELCS